jgi:hypothetical protein
VDFSMEKRHTCKVINNQSIEYTSYSMVNHTYLEGSRRKKG